MKLKIERYFALKNCLDGKYKQWADEIIEGIESQELTIFNTEDEVKFIDVYRNKEIDKFIKETARKKINISNYLPLVCQCIRFIDEDMDIELKKEQEEKKVLLASYWSNIKRAILPAPHMEPLGPSAFIGEIVLYDIESKLSPYKDESEEPFKYLIAHELVHAFNEMRIIVPAFLDWKAFWEKILQGGSCCQDARQLMARTNRNIDSYGSNKELKELKKYWPSKAEGWFNSYKELCLSEKN